MIHPLREKLLFVGPTNTGKTMAMFDVATRVIQAGKRVFWVAFDDGYMRHLSKVEGFLVFHTDPAMSSHEDGELFHLWDAGGLVEARKAMKEIKSQWEKGDWVMMDRVDLLWTAAQSYYINTHGSGVSLADDPKVDREGISEIETGGWPVVKDNHNSVVWECTEGTDARMLRINVAASVLANLGITNWSGKSKVEPRVQREDPRKLSSFGMTMEGEKNVPSYFEAIVVMERTPQGFVISTDKDRERQTFFRELMDGNKEGFCKGYYRLTGHEVKV